MVWNHPGLQVRQEVDWRGSEQSLEDFCRLEVWLEEEERRAWCQGTREAGELVWGWGGRQEEDEAGRGVAVRVEREVNGGSSASDISLSDDEEERLNEQEDHWAEVYFNSLIWRLERVEDSLLYEEKLENIWHKLFEDAGEEEREQENAEELGGPVLRWPRIWTLLELIWYRP